MGMYLNAVKALSLQGNFAYILILKKLTIKVSDGIYTSFDSNPVPHSTGE